ncbi:MAG: hypothetical protein H7A45_05060 [Verrucomicrobiales bacterium]|nr:hypothetical protein [Verrucomicrobiales bacterium]MCP5528566.1 hypothetical protein [Verrucomicrobiales bacterium]
MQDTQGITFLPSAPVTVAGLLVVVVTGVLGWLAWKRSGYRATIGGLELLRLLLVGLIAGTLCQPEWLRTQPPDQRPSLVVLWDESNSMQTRDVVEGDGTSEEPASRAEAMAPLLRNDAWQAADANLDLVFEPFSSPLDPPVEGTDLNAALARVLEAHANLRGVVVLSDGDWNVGKPPVEAATRFRMKGVPVFAVGVGSPTPLPDLEMASMDTPTFGVAEKPLRIPFVVRSTLGQDRDVTVTFSVNDVPVLTKVVRVPAMGQAQDNVAWTPPATGDFELRLEVPRDPQEVVSENNHLTTPITIRREQLQVLLVESQPRWEYRYLRNALERDPGVQVTCLLFHPQLPNVGGGRGYIDRFPAANELSRFDVVFLGDVGVAPKQLTLDQARDLRQLVTAQAAGLVFLPGRYGRQASLADSPLGDLYPVVMDPAHPNGMGSGLAGHFTLTQSGQRSLLTRLADTDQENTALWRALPGFFWHAAVDRARAGSDVLAVHDRETTASGRMPLIVTRTYGTGKVLFMGTDSAWRWREGVEDRYHYRFWGQVARWMAYQRQMAGGESMRLFYSPDRPQVDDVVTLNANVLDAAGGPLAEGTVVVQAVSPAGRTQTIRLRPGEEDAWGLFLGSFAPKEPGVHRLLATCAETGAAVETELSVQGLNRERLGRLARFDVLEEIAAVTKGRLVPVSEVGRLLDFLAALPEPEPTIHRTRLWSHPAWGGFLIMLLAAFWTGRKMAGTV